MATATKTCAYCAESFVLTTSPANIAKAKYCSTSCRDGAARSRTLPLAESLRARLSQRHYVSTSGCWIYTGQNNGIYGQIEYRRKTYLAHRASFMVHKGEIPDGICVCHTCDTPLCINPDHLWLGTYSDNVRDMISKKRAVYKPIKKLSDNQITEILGKLSEGAKCIDMASEYGVSDGYITMLRQGKRRTHITSPEQ